MRYWLRGTLPPVTRVLLVESGPRPLAQHFGPILRLVCGGAVDVDLLTCYGAPGEGIQILPRRVYTTQEYPSRRARVALLKELRANDYQVLAILCADSPVLQRWKWWLALRLPVKVLVANENADCFWLDRSNWRNAKSLLAARWGLQGTASLRTLAELAAFPFVLAWLLMYAVFAHTRRAYRVLFGLHRIRQSS
ncbi:MAG: hypothetical protein KIT83_13550 [Bryobacterales bacterium]|nr:hypothetical protein [Bryobacterales bacterium]